MSLQNFFSLLKTQKIVIPKIQRDYAQGRTDKEASRIRERFLENLCEALQSTNQTAPLKLDFIYGYSTEDKSGTGQTVRIFKPLDGQQRLTTLYLLFWYVAVTEGIPDSDIEWFSNFSYATRAKSRRFCEELFRFRPEPGSSQSIKTQIEEKPWFFLSWKSDPTISSMLVMLEAIERKFKEKNLQNIWPKLTGQNPSIVFHLLDMDDLGLPEDLYIKMNSRGKPLTQFEHFKAQFSRIIPSHLSEKFKTNIDKEWSDLFWDIFKTNTDTGEDLALKVDQAFLNFYSYITDYLLAVKFPNSKLNNAYWVEVAQTVYSTDDNVSFLFECLKTFVTQRQNKPTFFDDNFYVDKANYASNKVRLYFNNPQADLFQKCARFYQPEERNNPFSIGEQLLLFACIISLQENLENSPENLRKLRNLISASEDQLRKEYLNTLYDDVANIVRNKSLSTNTRFSKRQIAEEDLKHCLLKTQPLLKDAIYQLEDHALLRGTISILDINDTIADRANNFQKVFPESPCDYYSISKKMLSIGDYSQGYANHRRRLGNLNPSTWRELFTPSEKRIGFESTQRVLIEYLSRHSNITAPDVCDWRYYYYKYDSFRLWKGQPTDGFYHWNDFEKKPFECFMMYRSQMNGRHWNPFLLAISEKNTHCSLENYGNDLQFHIGQVVLSIAMQNLKFIFSAPDNDATSKAVIDECIAQKILEDGGVLPLEQVNHAEAEAKAEDKADRIIQCLEVLKRIEEICQQKGIA